MKKTILAATVMISFLILQSCNDSKKSEEKNDEKKEEKTTAHVKRNLTSSYRVPLATAQANIQHYTNKCTELFGTVPIRAYTIHAEDLMEVLGIPSSEPPIYQYSHVRAYLGLDTLNNFKLYLTPVEGANLNATPKIAGTDVILKEDSEEYVLDLNAPCPATCDLTSPLYYENTAKK